MCKTKDTDTNKDQNLDKTPENNDDQRVSVRFFKIILILTLLFAIVQIINCHLAKKRQDKICNLLYRTISIPNPLDTVFYSAMIIDSSVDKLDNLTIEKKLSIISSQNFHNRDEINYNQDIIRTIENVEKLLHLEFAKIQEERNALTLWIGIITVVFLIFSFYSMLKSDDLVKQSKDGLNKIQECNKKVEEIKTTWEKKISEVNEELKEKYKSLDVKFEELKTENEKTIVSYIDERFIDYKADYSNSSVDSSEEKIDDIENDKEYYTPNTDNLNSENSSDSLNKDKTKDDDEQ